ncbi:MAG: RNA polymerase sigma factor [Candidatus Pacebacteria bacterium]|nr:RNA polymerase sigma factor [Candidatus Paceibacterota bacterium]
MSTPIGDFQTDQTGIKEKAYLEAYEENMPRIFRHIASRVSDRKIAEDLTSETFFRAWDYIRKGSEVENMKAFCFKIANNLVVDHYRSKRPFLPIEDADNFVSSSRAEGDPELQVELALLRSHLADLPSDYGAILTYRYIDDLDISEIATITGKSHTHVYVLIHRAKNALRKKFERISRFS